MSSERWGVCNVSRELLQVDGSFSRKKDTAWVGRSMHEAALKAGEVDYKGGIKSLMAMIWICNLDRWKEAPGADRMHQSGVKSEPIPETMSEKPVVPESVPEWGGDGEEVEP